MAATQRRVILGVAVLLVLVVPVGPASACDVPIYQVAAEQWRPEPYGLFFWTQEGLKANDHLDKTIKTVLDNRKEFANVDVIRVDVHRPMLQEDRELMANRGIRALPYAVLLDGQGRTVTTLTGKLDEAAWKQLQAAAKPVGPFRVIAFTNTRFGRPAIDTSKPTPIPLVAIDLGEATEEQEALAEKYRIGWGQRPRAVLVDKDGQKITDVEGVLDAAAWAKLEAAAAPQPPFKVIAFTKAELGSPLPAGDHPTAFPVTVVDLDRADAAGKALAETHKVTNLPLVTLVSPRGKEIANFAADLGEGHLRETLQSPARAQIVKELKGKIAVLLVLRSKDQKANEKVLKIVRDGVSRGRRLFEGQIGLVEVDPTDAREEALFRMLGLPRDGKEPVVYAVFGPGKVLGVPPLKGDFTSDDVLDVVQIVLGPCSCIIEPTVLGEDLLLTWPMPAMRD